MVGFGPEVTAGAGTRQRSDVQQDTGAPTIETVGRSSIFLKHIG